MGTASNFWTSFFKGDLNLSVTMTFCSSVASFGLSTLWIWALGSQILGDSAEINIPYLQIFLTIISLVIPICLGMVFKWKKPKLAGKLRRFSKPVFLCFILVSVAFGIYINRTFFVLVEGRHVLCGIMLSLSGFIIGALAAFFARLNKEQIIAVSIETAVQNPAVAFLVMQGGEIESPYSDIGSLPVICYIGFAVGPPMLFVLIIFKIVEFIRNNWNPDTEKSDEESKEVEKASGVSGDMNLSADAANKANYGGASANKGFEN
eukprot:TRINITY_DN18992_c0_g1_i1.p1 TRINITY_DN18992_c0_g1~~TRINITY_DN18992_c0_g1_i1.p1  ORF type:complete len:263 (-),score=28.32 TRINITY_DN18992_c0_g1_i1:142-930(-)